MKVVASREQFEDWIDYLPDYLDEFMSLFPKEQQTSLDFSQESVDLVEAWLLATYPDTQSMLHSDASQLVNLFACYIGEVCCRAKGAKWDIRLDDPNYVYFGLPIVVGPRNSVCPLTLATTAADRRTGKFIRPILNNL